MRRALPLCLALLLAPAALAAKPVFELRSQVLTRIPAIASALAALEQAPEDAIAWRSLGRELAERGAYVDAIRAFERASKLDRQNPDVWVDLGATYLRSGDPDAALSPLRQALKLEPFHAIAHYDLGIAYQARGDMDPAWDSFESALRIDPSLGDPMQNPAAVVNPDLPYVKLRVYLRTTGTSPALFGDSPLLGRIDDGGGVTPPSRTDDTDVPQKSQPKPADGYKPSF